ncbi:MAG: PEGA domain-containing protein, partial [Bdellovibrionales bacterium]|nr:PEGA domain-containing protein [Bdellovibrionales bacterium]
EPLELEIKLEGKPQSVAITSDPLGSKVFLENRYLGDTPLQTTLASGIHILTLKKEGFIDQQKIVNISGNKKNVLPVIEMKKMTSEEEYLTNQSFMFGLDLGINRLPIDSSQATAPSTGFIIGLRATKLINKNYEIGGIFSYSIYGTSGGEIKDANGNSTYTTPDDNAKQKDVSLRFNYIFEKGLYIGTSFGSSKVDYNNKIKDDSLSPEFDSASDSSGFNSLAFGFKPKVNTLSRNIYGAEVEIKNFHNSDWKKQILLQFVMSLKLGNN